MAAQALLIPCTTPGSLQLPRALFPMASITGLPQCTDLQTQESLGQATPGQGWQQGTGVRKWAPLPRVGPMPVSLLSKSPWGQRSPPQGIRPESHPCLASSFPHPLLLFFLFPSSWFLWKEIINNE